MKLFVWFKNVWYLTFMYWLEFTETLRIVIISQKFHNYFEKFQCQIIFFLNTHKNNTCLQLILMFVPLSAMINEIIDEFCMLSSIYRQRYKVSVFLSSWALKHKFKCGYNNDMVYSVSWYIALENGNKIDEINRVRTKAAHNKCFNLYLLYL